MVMAAIEKGYNVPPGVKFLGCGVDAVAAPEDRRDLSKKETETFTHKLDKTKMFLKQEDY